MHSRKGQRKGYYLMKFFRSLVPLFPSRYDCTERNAEHTSEDVTLRLWYMYPIFWLFVISYLISHLHFTHIKGLSLGSVFSSSMPFLSFVPYVFYHVLSLFIEYFLVFVTYWYSYTSVLTSFERKERRDRILNSWAPTLEFRPFELCQGKSETRAFLQHGFCCNRPNTYLLPQN
jgi:hypothetical protein